MVEATMSTRIFGLLLSVRNCHRNDGNRADSCCSGSQSGEAIVGHVSKKRSSVCSIYAGAARSELIVCQLTGSRRFSGDLVQGHHVNFWSQTVLCSSCWNENFEVFKIWYEKKIFIFAFRSFMQNMWYFAPYEIFHYTVVLVMTLLIMISEVLRCGLAWIAFLISAFFLDRYFRRWVDRVVV